jgi:TonB family protein
MLHLLPDTGLYRPDPKSNLYSVVIHAAVIAVLFLLASHKAIPVAVRNAVPLFDPALAPLLLHAHAGGGGGGGTSMPMPASKGVLPPKSQRQFVPPSAVPVEAAKLTLQPTIVAPPDAVLPQLGPYGDPLGKLGIASNGPGTGGGIGDGTRGGVGEYVGPGKGPGPCCGGTSGSYTAGIDGVTAPKVLLQVEPQYSDEARKAKISGIVILDLVVDREGHARSIHVLHGAGLGLDEKAMEAVQQWRFKPGTKAGVPVAVHARVEVNFRLL